MILKTLVVGALRANCHVIGCEKTRRAIVIDPGGDAELILKTLASLDLQCELILDTHGHADHIAANDEVRDATAARILIHESDAPMLVSAEKNLSVWSGHQIELRVHDELVADGSVIRVGEIGLCVIHTPGHTPGGICVRHADALFSGDTLFLESIGRSDLPGGCTTTLLNSIKSKLLTLPPDTRVFPGHGAPTTIGHERRNNPFVGGMQTDSDI